MVFNRRIATGPPGLAGAAVLCFFAAVSDVAAGRVIDVRDYGAKPDGKTLCTPSIQKAIDHCAAEGGGTVRLPAGTWLCGTIYMESHVTLSLDSGCTLLGSPDPNDYAHERILPRENGEKESFRCWAIVAGKNLENVAIGGRGTIDGGGSAFLWKGSGRPKGIYLIDCRDVLVENLSMRNAGSWMQHYRLCRGLVVRGITVFNHATYNNDGLNVDSCRDVRISNCLVDSDDDAVVLKSLSNRPCRNVAITNCVIRSHCNAIKMGTESGGGFQNIAVSNCTIQSPRDSEAIYGRQRGLAGIALEIVDGGKLDRVAVSNIVIEGVSVAIFMRLGNRARQYEEGDEQPGVGTFQNVVVSNVVAVDTSQIGCSITGLPGHKIENVSLSNINLGFEGGGTKEDAFKDVPEKPESYPESTMFGVLPAYGFYCRHVKNLRLDNVRLETDQPDARHALVCDDVEDLAIDGLDAACWEDAEAIVRLRQVKGALIRGCRPPATVDVFLRLEGDATRGVVLAGNDLSRAGKVVDAAPEVPEDALSRRSRSTK